MGDVAQKPPAVSRPNGAGTRPSTVEYGVPRSQGAHDLARQFVPTARAALVGTRDLEVSGRVLDDDTSSVARDQTGAPGAVLDDLDVERCQLADLSREAWSLILALAPLLTDQRCLCLVLSIPHG